jgi:hypothetical protein
MKINQKSCHILMKLEFYRQIYEKYKYTTFYENPSLGNRAVPYGRTDITKLTVAFHNIADVPKNG